MRATADKETRMSDPLLDAARQALDTLTHIIGMRHLSYIGQAMAESAERTLRTATSTDELERR